MITWLVLIVHNLLKLDPQHYLYNLVNSNFFKLNLNLEQYLLQQAWHTSMSIKSPLIGKAIKNPSLMSCIIIDDHVKRTTRIVL